MDIDIGSFPAPSADNLDIDYAMLQFKTEVIDKLAKTVDLKPSGCGIRLTFVNGTFHDPTLPPFVSIGVATPYTIVARMNTQQKQDICKYLTDRRHVVYPRRFNATRKDSKDPGYVTDCLVANSTNVGAKSLRNALLHAQVKHVILLSCGTKRKWSSFAREINPLIQRYGMGDDYPNAFDVGIVIETGNNIPLVHVSQPRSGTINRHKVFGFIPLLPGFAVEDRGNVSGVFGSFNYVPPTTQPHIRNMDVYQEVVHHTKATLANWNAYSSIPETFKTLRRRVSGIESALKLIQEQNWMLGGLRLEVRIVMGELDATNEHIHQYLNLENFCSNTQVQIRIKGFNQELFSRQMDHMLQYAKIVKLFTGADADKVGMTQQCAYSDLLNASSLNLGKSSRFIHKFRWPRLNIFFPNKAIQVADDVAETIGVPGFFLRTGESGNPHEIMDSAFVSTSVAEADEVRAQPREEDAILATIIAEAKIMKHSSPFSNKWGARVKKRGGWCHCALSVAEVAKKIWEAHGEEWRDHVTLK